MPPKKSQVIVRKYKKATVEKIVEDNSDNVKNVEDGADVDNVDNEADVDNVEDEADADHDDIEDNTTEETTDLNHLNHLNYRNYHNDHALRKVVAGSSKKKPPSERKTRHKMGEEVVADDIGDKIPELEVVSDKIKEKYEYKPLLHTEIVYTLPEDRITSEVMTKFELCEVVSIRAKQIENGGESFTDIGDLTDPLEIAKKEILDKKCPLDIVRMKTDKIAERWHVNEMGIPFD